MQYRIFKPVTLYLLILTKLDRRFLISRKLIANSGLWAYDTQRSESIGVYAVGTLRFYLFQKLRPSNGYVSSPFWEMIDFDQQ